MSLACQPLIFLDIDDVICLNDPYGGYDVMVRPQPVDLWERLFSKPATDILLGVLREHCARVVLTTSWTQLMARCTFEETFHASGLSVLAESLHEEHEAWQARDESRLDAINRWLVRSYKGQQYVVIDDHYSGTNLLGSHIDRAGRLVMCEVGVGLQESHVVNIRKALRHMS